VPKTQSYPAEEPYHRRVTSDLPAPVSAAIRALLPPPEAEEAAYLPAFRAIADVLLNRATLVAGGAPHRLTEVEFYFNGNRHLDEFTHGDPIQEDLGLWYFHRTRGEYRSGTYKGLDVTIGRGEAKGGILLRGAEPVGEPDALVDGPSMLVDRILRLTGSATIQDLVGAFDGRVDPPPGGTSPLHLAPEPARGLAIYECARVGLALKWGNIENRQRFFARPYRFLTEPARIRKGKVQLALGLHRRGVETAEIARITATRAAVIEKYVALYEAGRRKSPAAFRRDLSTGDLCELLGACHDLG
jgi:hypothetical protein